VTSATWSPEVFFRIPATTRFRIRSPQSNYLRSCGWLGGAGYHPTHPSRRSRKDHRSLAFAHGFHRLPFHLTQLIWPRTQPQVAKEAGGKIGGEELERCTSDDSDESHHDEITIVAMELQNIPVTRPATLNCSNNFRYVSYRTFDHTHNLIQCRCEALQGA
jgi:hypothetical protein